MQMTAQQGLGLAWLIEHEQGRDFFLAAPNMAHWLQVDFPTGDKRYAIWNSTGSVYECEGPYNAVADDPIYTPPHYSALEKSARAMAEADRQSDAVDALVLLILRGNGQSLFAVHDQLRQEIEKIAPGRLDRLGDINRVRQNV